MTHKSGTQHGDLDELLNQLDHLSSFPHLKEIAERLLEPLEVVSKSNWSNEDVRALVTSVKETLGKLPRPQLDRSRFLFDAALIQSFADALESVSHPISRMILPTCGDEWAHRYLYLLPSLDGKRIPRVDLITFRGEDNLHNVFLIDYPWLYHELGHVLVYDHWQTFEGPFAQSLDNVVKNLQARALADSPVNKERAKATISNLEKLWCLGDGPHSWALEIASDVIALYACGPSFLAAFDRELDSPQLDPYVISHAHPPYEIRSIALTRAGSKLGWERYAPSLRDRVKAWRKSSFAEHRNNEYVGYANDEILDGAILSALEMCTNLKLPQCDGNKIQTIRTVLPDKDNLDFGIDLVIAAWLVYEELGIDKYSSWETDVVSKLTNTLTL